jgi:ABC-type nitrate/sulfonate/bicarbonate transport system ATPase subunit
MTIDDRRPAGLVIEDIHKTFFKKNGGDITGVHALGGVSINVAPGEFVSVIGPSGCGKSTLLRTVDGLIKPDRGRVLVDGKVVSGPGPDRAVVFQYFGLYPWRTVVRNVEFGLELSGASKADRRGKALANIQRVGLKGFENHYPHELSGGMRQRVGLARALALDPRIILMDEPFSAVDEQTRELLQEQLLGVWAETRKTILFITHSIDEAVFMSDRIVVMGARPGRILEVIDVDLPRPRSSSRSLPRFGEIRAYAWELLKQGVIESAMLEMAQ